MLDEKNFTIVDLETTGGSAYFNRIIEIGVLRVERGEVVARYSQSINPQIPIPEMITKITGLTDRDVAGAPLFEEVADELITFFEDAIFVAHNVMFDYSFLKEEYRRLGYSFNLDRLCTVRLSRALFPQHKRHNLAALIERHEFEAGNRHRAFDDAHVLWQFFQTIKTTFDAETLQLGLQKATTKLRKPNALTPQSTETF